MKKLRSKIYWSLPILVLSMLVIQSCKEEETIFKGPYHVRFSNESASERESYNRVIQIPVHFAGPHLSEPITVRYSISGTAREGIDYQIAGTRGLVKIPAGESTGYIDLQLINNANNILESQNIVFTITEVTPENIQIGRSMNGIIGRSTVFTIMDDCLLSGTYRGILDTENGPEEKGIRITGDENCETYTLSNWNIGLMGFPVKLDLQFIDNYDNTLTIPRQFEERLSAPSDTIQGTGSINPLNGHITLNVELKLRVAENRDSTVVFPLVFIRE